MYLIKEAAQISGVTIRTLHHYDQIGLLKVNKSDNGYRYYTNEDIENIKIIRYYRFLGFSLDKIRKIMNGKMLILMRSKNMPLNIEIKIFYYLKCVK